MPRTAASAARPSRRRTPTPAALVPAMTGFLVSQEALPLFTQSRAKRSGLTSAFRQQATASVVLPRRASPRASAAKFFTTLKVGNGAEISELLKNASPEQLAQTDRIDNNALHYLAQNTTLDPHAFAELMFLYGDDIEYKADDKGKTPLAIVLSHHPNFPFIQALLGEESDFNRETKKGKTMVHYLYKNTTLPIEDLAYINKQLLEADINKDKVSSALPILATNLLKRYDMPSPVRSGIAIPNGRTKQTVAVELFSDMVRYIGFEKETALNAIINTLQVLKAAADADASKRAFIKQLTETVFNAIPMETKETLRKQFKDIVYGGKKRPVRARAASAKKKAVKAKP